MFNVKFYGANSIGELIQCSISCQSYEVYTRENGRITVTTHAKMTTEDGVERHVGNEPGDFQTCYVENAHGKTVDVFRANKTRK